ncbi:hypothetical protein GCM10023085_40970 [Actinomadura viridis]|uniref:Uncharacterized protein n=1 Tax=Actinomadura viridis TaxID=58110 RepID=A0A931DK20_9ACTN|nr:hypothetical protein [Actinomadura viridis]MBG6092624.1 hypothetical protein [Actinomadura viridis]
MDPENLVALLDRDEDAYIACRAALVNGAALETSARPVPVPDLIPTYTVREANTRENGIPTLGFADALHDLQACELGEVLLWSVEQRDPAYYFLLFVSPNEQAVIACIGVSQDPATGRTAVGRSAPARPVRH